MQRTKRPTELKIVFEKITLINRNFGNACEYVTDKDLGELFRRKYFGTWATLQKWMLIDKKKFLASFLVSIEIQLLVLLFWTADLYSSNFHLSPCGYDSNFILLIIPVFKLIRILQVLNYSFVSMPNSLLILTANCSWKLTKVFHRKNSACLW